MTNTLRDLPSSSIVKTVTEIHKNTMQASIVFMFSGQGSQYFQMGRELFIRHHVFRDWMLRLDEIVHENIGERIIDYLYDEKRRKDERFDRTLHTHPAIFMVQYSLAQVLLESGLKPDYVLGSSLGEFVSATVAGVMGIAEALEAVLKQAEVFESHCQKSGMLAILHGPSLYRETPLISERTELVSVNYDEHFVIAGKNDDLKGITGYLKRQNILYMELPVSYGFHSSFIDPAAEAYKDFLKYKKFLSPRISFVSCLFGNTLGHIPENYLWDVVRSPIELRRAIQTLENGQKCTYLDLGPAGTLANFVKRNLDHGSQSECFAFITPFNQELRNLGKIQTVIHS